MEAVSKPVNMAGWMCDVSTCCCCVAFSARSVAVYEFPSTVCQTGEYNWAAAEEDDEALTLKQWFHSLLCEGNVK